MFPTYRLDLVGKPLRKNRGSPRWTSTGQKVELCIYLPKWSSRQALPPRETRPRTAVPSTSTSKCEISHEPLINFLNFVFSLVKADQQHDCVHGDAPTCLSRVALNHKVEHACHVRCDLSLRRWYPLYGCAFGSCRLLVRQVIKNKCRIAPAFHGYDNPRLCESAYDRGSTFQFRRFRMAGRFDLRNYPVRLE